MQPGAPCWLIPEAPWLNANWSSLTKCYPEIPDWMIPKPPDWMLPEPPNWMLPEAPGLNATHKLPDWMLREAPWLNATRSFLTEYHPKLPDWMLPGAPDWLLSDAPWLNATWSSLTECYTKLPDWMLPEAPRLNATRSSLTECYPKLPDWMTHQTTHWIARAWFSWQTTFCKLFVRAHNYFAIVIHILLSKAWRNLIYISNINDKLLIESHLLTR